MIYNKILNNEFTWIPKGNIQGRVPPRKLESRKPLLWLKRTRTELYLVNSSNETLDTVKVQTGGFLTADEEVLTINNGRYNSHYISIKPNQAVKIEEYDNMYDLDFVLNVSIEIKSSNLGMIEITSPADKGGVKECVLLWDTKEPGKNVHIKTIHSL